jgi:hypothetical protein
MEFHLNDLELPHYRGYAAGSIPVQIAGGRLSGAVTLRFVQRGRDMHISLSGTTVLDELVLHDGDDAPFLELAHGQASLADVRPLESYARLNVLRLEGLAVECALRTAGCENLTRIAGAAKRSLRAPIESPAPPAVKDAPPAQASEAFDFGVAELTLTGGAARVRAGTANDARLLAWEPIDLKLEKYQSRSESPAAFQLQSKLAGGTLAAHGSIMPAAGVADLEIEGRELDLPALLAVAPVKLPAPVAAGVLEFGGKLKVEYGERFDVHAEPARAAVASFSLEAQGD